MEVFKDEKTGLQFCNMDKKLEKIQSYELIKWCEQYLEKGKIFIDIGGGIGEYSLILSRKCKQVFYFEMDEEKYNCLHVSMSINNIFNIKSYKNGLGNCEKKEIFNDFENPGYSGLFKKIPDNIKKSHEVEIKSLDSYNIENINLIRLNSRGYEIEVIMGAITTLINNKFPPIIFEIWNNEWFKDYKEMLFSILKNLGYRISPISGTNNIYIASDHKLYEKIKPNNNEEIDELMEKYNNITGNEKMEDFCKLARDLRMKCKYKEGYDLIQKALILNPTKENLNSLYIDLSYILYYIDKKNEGMDICEKIVLGRDFTQWERNEILLVESYYMKKLNIKERIPINFIVPDILYVASSASIIKNTNGYIINVRAINYEINKKGLYVIRHGDGVVRTKNYIFHTDNFDKLDEKKTELVDASNFLMYQHHITGLEDIRLITEDKFFCTCLQVNENNIPQICFCTYDSKGIISKIIPLKTTEKIQCEKNWMPFVKNNEIYFIYSIEPLTIYKLELSGDIHLHKKIQISDCYMRDFRGSASPISYNNGWLCTIHQVHYHDQRKYFHRFMWFDNDFNCLVFSRPFYFEHVGIEFNLSICHSDNGLLMTYSVNDASSIIAVVDYNTIDDMLGVNHNSQII